MPPRRLRTEIRGESFHSGWELQILADVDVVALAPASVALELPEGIAVRLVELVQAVCERAADAALVTGGQRLAQARGQLELAPSGVAQ